MDYQIDNRKYCMLKGHEDNRTSYIRIYKQGQYTQEWLCFDCILQYFDNLGRPELNHDMRKKLFLDFIKQQSWPIYHQSIEAKKQIQIRIMGLQQLIKSTQFLVEQLLEDLTTIDENIMEIEEIINETQKDHNLLKSQQIDTIINLNNWNKQFDYSLSSDQLKQIIQHYVDLQYLFQNKNKNKNNNKKQNNILTKQEVDHFKNSVDDGNQIQGVSKKTNNQKNDTVDSINGCIQNTVNSSKTIPEKENRKYIIQEIDQTTTYYGSSLSTNQKYLSYGGSDTLLKIYDIKQKKLLQKKIKVENCINVCQFTQDSSQLYIGLEGGYAYGYDVLDDFKEIYKQKIHSNHLYNLITIQNEFLITCSYDKSIIKTNIKSKQQMFKLTHKHTGYIVAIDYNDKDEIIVSGSADQSIKLWDCRNQSIIINKEQSHNNGIAQIQLINNNLNILSLDMDGNLYKWKIDLTNKDLIKLQQFRDQNKIFNFYQVNQDQNLLLICNNYAKILNQQGETINTIQHGGQDSYPLYDCRQLDNLKFILIRTLKKIILAISQD